MRFVSGIAIAAALTGCAVLSQRDLHDEYLSQVRAIGLTPVYPPRGEVQVGDVYFVVVPAGGDDDSAITLWVSSMNSVRDQALAYLSSRDDIGAFMPNGTATAPAVAQLGRMRELPAVNFPTISGSAASSASLGAISPVLSGVFSIGSADTVSMKFVDVRVFGAPFLTASISDTDFRNSVCPLIESRTSSMQQVLGLDRSPCSDSDAVSRGESCELHIVTRTYLTRHIQFNFNQRRRIAGGASVVQQLRSPAPVAAVPSVTVNIDANTAPDTATSVITALRAPATSSVSTIAAVAVSETSQGIAFDQQFRSPLVIAYESRSLTLSQADELCRPS